MRECETCGVKVLSDEMVKTKGGKTPAKRFYYICCQHAKKKEDCKCINPYQGESNA